MQSDLSQTSLCLRRRGPLVLADSLQIAALVIEARDLATYVSIDGAEVTEFDVSFLQTLIAADKTATLERKTLMVAAGGSEEFAAQIARCGLPSSLRPDFSNVFTRLQD